MSKYKVINWYKPNFGSCAIHMARLSTGERAFVISSLDPTKKPWKVLENERGYEASADGEYLYKVYKDDEKDIASQDLREAFPALSKKQCFQSTVYLSEPEFQKIAHEIRKVEMIGLNHLGEEVFQSSGHRYVIDRDGKQHTEPKELGSEEMPYSRFLYAKERHDVHKIADGFVRRMTLGAAMRPMDIRKIVNVMRNKRGYAPETDPALRKMQEAVEAAAQRRLKNELTESFAQNPTGKAAFDFAHKIHVNQPTAAFRTGESVTFDQYSTPLPMSLAAQSIFPSLEGKSILEPTIGNGSLVMAAPESATVYGVEIDKSRHDRALLIAPQAKILCADYLQTNAMPLGQKADLVISNPPFSGLGKPVLFDGMKVGRKDYLIACKALAERKDEGVGVFIVGSDYDNMNKKNLGSVNKTSQVFLKYLSDNYELLDAFEVTGSLYAKQGASFPTRMIVVGNRRSADEAAARAKKPDVEILNGNSFKFGASEIELDVVHDYEDLFDRCSEVKHFITKHYAPKQEAVAQTEPPKQIETQVETPKPIPKKDELSVFDGDLFSQLEDEPIEQAMAEPQAQEATATQAEVQPTQPEQPEQPEQPKPLSVEEKNALIDKKIKQEELKINEYQRPYVPYCGGEGSLMIPANLQGPIDQAFTRYMAKNDLPIKEFVAKECGFDDNIMEVLFPEQIDTLYLALNKRKEGLGFINGGWTGTGKGMIQASLIASSLRAGKTVIFVTEKPNLFSDMCRDLIDVGVWPEVKPFVMNSDTDVMNPSNEIAVKRFKSADIKKVMDKVSEDGLSLQDQGYNVMFMTYSQINRMGSSKAAFAQQVASMDCDLYLDESHNAAGDSNINANTIAMVEAANSVCYSSATFSKGAKNMSVYQKAFPDSINLTTLAETLAMGGDLLLEIISEMLTRYGAYMRHEPDQSRKERVVWRDEKNFDRNVEINDQHARIMRAMSYLSGDIERDIVNPAKASVKVQLQELSPEQRKGNRMGVQYSNFGSRLYNLMQQFILTIKLPAIIESNLKSLQEGAAPLNFLTNTNEGAILSFFEQAKRGKNVAFTDEDESSDGEQDDLLRELDEIKKVKAGLSSDQPESETQMAFAEDGLFPVYSYGDLLKRMLHRLLIIKTTDFRGNVTEENATEMYIPDADDEEQAAFHQSFKDNVKHIESMIDALPYLPISPIDAIHQAIEEYQPKEMGEAFNFKCGELSGRKFKFRVVKDDLGKPIAMKMEPIKGNRTEHIADFNNGKTQVITFTTAGSTGCSLHDSERNPVQAQRHYNECQIPTNQNVRKQAEGRGDRRGQVTQPIYISYQTGLAAEDRFLAAANAKERKQAAVTQSNRRNDAIIEEVPDILNDFGETICKDVMEGRPDLCKMLGIKEEDFETESDQENFFINRVFNRASAVLENHLGKALIEDIYSEYQIRLAELQSQGMSPFTTKEVQVKARKVESKIVLGTEAEDYESPFSEPVYITKYEWDVEIEPKRWDWIKEKIRESREDLKSKGFDVVDALHKWANLSGRGQFFTDYKDAIALKMEEAKPDEFQTVRDAINASSPNIVQRLQTRQETIENLLKTFVPGQLVQIMDHTYGIRNCLVIDLDVPTEEKHMHNLGSYKVKMISPGMSQPIHASFFQLSMDENVRPIHTMNFEHRDTVNKLFDSAPAGKFIESSYFLTGNLFKAVEISQDRNLGKTVILELEDGTTQRCVMLKRDVNQQTLMNLPIDLNRVPHVINYLELLRRKSVTPTVSTMNFVKVRDVQRDISTVLVATGDYNYTLSVPGAKDLSAAFFTDSRLKQLFGAGADFSGSRHTMTITSNSNSCVNVEDVVTYLYQAHKIRFKSDGKFHDEVNAIVSESDKAMAANNDSTEQDSDSTTLKSA